MTREKFLHLLAAIVEAPSDTFLPNTQLADTGLWDSMAWVQVIGMCDDCGVEVTGEQVSKCETAAEVLTLAGLA